MIKIIKIYKIAVLMIAFSFISVAAPPTQGEPLKGGSITLKCENGKSVSAKIDDKGKFQFPDFDDACDSYTIEIKTKNQLYVASNLNISGKQTQQASFGEKVQSGLAQTGSAIAKRQHKPFNYKVSASIMIDGKTQITGRKIIIELKSDGTNILGFAIKENGVK